MKHSVIYIIFCMAASMLCSIAAFGQNVSGTVKDAGGNPVVGAVVMLEGAKSVGSMTDANGNYSISIPSGTKNPVLNYSVIGMKTVTETVAGRTIINVVMQDDFEVLDEVVVVGYGSMRKSDLTGSVTSVKIDEDEAAMDTSIDQMLMGHAAGVEVINSSEAPDAGVSIRIRGITSLNGSCEPLYVVDGVILTSASISTGIDADEEVNSLMGLNPNDIASLQILKDASATAIYGAAGANGVVLITTKQGNQDKPRINFNVGVDICTPYKKIDVLDFDEYTEYLKEREYSGNSASKWMYEGLFENYGTPEQTLKVVIRDWQNLYLRNSLRQRYWFGATAHPNSLWYSASIGYNKSNGVVENTNSEQLTARLNLSKDFTKKFNMGFKVNIGYVRSRQLQGAGSGENGVSSSFIKSLVSFRPYLDHNETEDDFYDPGDYASSPSNWVNDSYQTRIETRITPNLSFTYKIADWVKFKTSAGADYHMREMTKYRGYSVAKSPSSGAVNYGDFYSINWDNTFEFNKKFGKKHNLSGTVGFSMNRKGECFNNVNSSEITQYGIGVDNIDSSPYAKLTYSEKSESQLSTFARAVYNYDDRYVLTATYRLDGSSRFAKKNRFSGFPSMAAAWRLSQEPWFKVPVISMTKFRLGWGRVGNCSVRPYQYMSTYGQSYQGNHFNDADYIITIYPNVLTNEDLKWETTEQWNVGLDFAMWKGRLSLTVDAYYKNTYDLLQQRSVTYNTGFANMYVNQGSILNKGLEISVEAIPVKTYNFEWSLNGNISFNRNQLTDLGFEGTTSDFYFEPGVKTEQRYYTGATLGSGGYLSGAPINIYMLGQPIGLFYGYKTDGLVQEGEYGIPFNKSNYSTDTYAKPGSIKYVDMNGDGYISEKDRTVIGNANPIFTFGFSTSFTYKKWKLSANFNGSYGNQIFNANLTQFSDTHTSTTANNVISGAYKNAWTIANPTNRFVGLSDSYTHYGVLFDNVWHTTEKQYATDRDIEDASYLRLANIMLSYTFDLPKKSPLKKINVGFSVSNLFILTRYSGFSPIVNSYSLSSQKIGVDAGGYPSSRNYGFDVKLTF